LNVNNNLTFNNLNISGYTVCPLPEYPDNTTAAVGGIPYWGLYRTGGLVKIRLDIITPVAILNGTNLINLYIGDTFIDPGATITDNLNEVINTKITGTVDTNTAGTYNLIYYGIDSYNNYSNNVTRTVNVFTYPTFSTITLSSNVITFTISGSYSVLTYQITKNNNIIVDETILGTNSINISSLTLDSIPHYVIINLKQSSNVIITTATIAVTNTNFGPVLFINGNNSKSMYSASAYSLLRDVNAKNLPANTNITLTNSNISVKNSSQATVIITNSLLPTSYTDIFTITYSVTGSNGISVNSSITIQTIDNSPPVLTLLGQTQTSILNGNIFTDPGVTATDNIDGTRQVFMTSLVQKNKNLLTEDILIAGTTTSILKTSELPRGTYIATYKSTDNANNIGYITRSIIIANFLYNPSLAQLGNILSYSHIYTYNTSTNTWNNWIFDASMWSWNNSLIRNALGNSTTDGYLRYTLSLIPVKSVIIVAKYLPLGVTKSLINSNSSDTYYLSFSTTAFYSSNLPTYTVKIDNYTTVTQNGSTYNFIDGKWHIIQITNINLSQWTGSLQINGYSTSAHNMGNNSAVIAIVTYNTNLTESDLVTNYNAFAPVLAELNKT
jgi:hypothetical protein